MQITQITEDIFYKTEQYLIDNDLDSDKDKFSVIRDRLQRSPVLNPEQFAEELVYTTLTSGFKQTTAKRFFYRIVDFLHNYTGNESDEKDSSEKQNKLVEKLLNIFRNKNKVNAIANIWLNRQKYHDEFYLLNGDESRLKYLKTLPHVGEITKYHIARNLGVNCVKYDIWIQRIAVALYDKSRQNLDKINNGKLNLDVKDVCDSMFYELSSELNLPRGYIDLILWKSCQQGIFKIKGYRVDFIL